MANSSFGRRKQRTRQHVIADLSVHHVEGFILEKGHTAQRFGSDYSYDLLMNTFDEVGYAEPGTIYFQLKAAESLQAIGSAYVYDVDIRDYNLWINEEMPVVLILFDAVRKKAYWLAVQSYFREATARQPQKWAKTVRVRVPKRQAVNRAAIDRMRDLKGHMLRSNWEFNHEKDRFYLRATRKVLRALGFVCRPGNNEPPGRIYEHQKTGAVVMLPASPRPTKCTNTFGSRANGSRQFRHCRCHGVRRQAAEGGMMPGCLWHQPYFTVIRRAMQFRLVSNASILKRRLLSTTL